MRRILIFAVAFAIASCTLLLEPPTSVSFSGSDFASADLQKLEEIELLSDVSELDAFFKSRSDAVDWRLSREFAQLWLEQSIFLGEYPSGSTLSETPIPIYSPDGKVRFYEFIVLACGQPIAYITGAATKEFSCPILFQSFSAGHSDKLSRLRDTEEGKRLRLVDNGYPRVAFAFFDRMGEDGSPIFDSFADASSERIERDGIAHMVKYSQFSAKAILPKMSDGVISSKSGSDAEASLFWELAEKHKGSVSALSTPRSLVAKSKSVRTSLDRDCICNAFHVNGDYWHVTNYGACGAVCAGFVLDYLLANQYVFAQWSRMRGFEAKKRALYDAMAIGENSAGDVVEIAVGEGENVTLPSDIGNAISMYSGYEVRLSPYAYPKLSINDNIPGISLRLFSNGGMHYRNVIAYRTNGWGPFCWPSFKILDLVDSSDLREGSWETFIPAYHALNWNIVKK